MTQAGQAPVPPPPQRFARLRFQGDRFSGPIFPVEALPELATYRDLVLEAAKAIWYAEHPHRKIAPRGFDAAFSLMLESIEDGSTMPILVRAAVLAASIQGMSPADAETYYDRGRELVAEVVEAAAKDGPLPALVTGRLGSRFASFGARLQPSDRIQLVTSMNGSPTGPTFTLEAREKIVSSIPSEYADDVDLYGEIVKADKVKNSFELLSDGRRVPFEADPDLAAELLTWMRDDVLVRIRGKAIHRTVGGFLRLEVASIAMVQQNLDVADSAPCPLPIRVQLADIARLEDGWLDGDGFAYAPPSIALARELFEALLELGALEMPYLYPSPDRAIRAEWNHPDRDVVVTLDEKATRLRLLIVEVGGDKPARREIYETDHKGLKSLASLLEDALKQEDGP